MTTRPFLHHRGLMLPDVERIRQITASSCKAIVSWVVERLTEPMPKLKGTGCVMVAGGRYCAEAFASLSLLRQSGWQHPIHVWYLGKQELNDQFRNACSKLDCELVNAVAHGYNNNRYRMRGWSAKPYAIKHCPFEHVLSLDTDCFVQRDISPLFRSPEYQRDGIVLAPDIRQQLPSQEIWRQMGIERPACFVEAESGQLLVDKAKTWRGVLLAEWMNGRWEHFYRYMHGDKETWTLAFLRLGMPYSMLPPCVWEDDGMLHHWFDGNPFTHHACGAKRGGRYRPSVQNLINEYSRTK